MLEKFYYFMVAAQVTFITSEGDSNLTRVNALVESPTENFTVKELARAQQGAQINLFEKLGGPVQVLDVIFLSISKLGHMSKEEFYQKTDEAAPSTVTVDG